MEAFETLQGIDKAAVLFNVLGETLAITLFKQLEEKDIIKIRVRAREIGVVDPTVRKTVLEEYYFKIISEKYENESSSDSTELFDFVLSLSDEQIFYLLGKEKPRIIALVMEQLPEEKKIPFLNKLDTKLKNKVVLEIGNLDEIPLEAVINVAKELEKKIPFLPESKEFSRGGGKSMAQILSTMSEEDAKLYLEQIELDDPELYEEVRKYFYTFEDLLGLPKEKMRELFNTIEVDDVALSLKGLGDDKLTLVSDTLPPKKQKMIDPITVPTPKRDVMQARKRVVDVAKEMEKEGKLSIEDLTGGEMID